MNTYQVFRIVLGLVASFFILYFLIYYAGVYSEMQENTQRMIIVNNFKKAAEDVYNTGNPVTFDDFSILDFDITYNGLVEPAVITTQAGQQIIRTPVVFLPGEKLIIDKKYLDFGWWRFDFVEALPETTIIFNPTDVGRDSKNLMKSIVGLFPETMGRTPKIMFGFCNGGSFVMPCNSGSSLCEGFDFRNRIEFLTAPMSSCSIGLGDDQVLVTISPACSGSPDQGVCIAPPVGGSSHGYAYLNDSADFYIYKNPLDILALIVGADKENIYGPISENLYVYENRMIRREMGLMSDIMWHRSSLIAQNLMAQPPGYDKNTECRNLHGVLAIALENIKAIISDEEYYKDAGSVSDLIVELNNADNTYQNLVNLGCDYMVE